MQRTISEFRTKNINDLVKRFELPNQNSQKMIYSKDANGRICLLNTKINYTDKHVPNYNNIDSQSDDQSEINIKRSTIKDHRLSLTDSDIFIDEDKTKKDEIIDDTRFKFIMNFLRFLPGMSFTGMGIFSLIIIFLFPRSCCQNLLFPAFRLLFGTLYPAYASYKAVRTKNVKEYVKWMMYWIVFAFFSFFETITDIFLSWFPFYYEVKVILVLWLLSPATKGSSTLYRKFVHPMLTRREQDIDEYITQAKEKGYTAVLQLGSKGVNYATNVIMQTAIKNLILSNGSGNIIKTSQSDNSLRSSALQTATLTEIDETPIDTDTIDYIRMQRSISVDSALTNKRNANNGKYNLRSHDMILEVSDDEDNTLLSEMILHDKGAARSRELIPTRHGKQLNTVSTKGNGKGTGIKGRRRLKQDINEMDVDVHID